MNLLGKLRAISAEKSQSAPVPSPDFVDCWERTQVRPMSEFPELSFLTRRAVMLMQHDEMPDPLHPRQILFLDTETTGLGGGAGTVAFEIGLGRLTHEGFAVTQYVMRDYPEERFMLEKVAAALSDSDVICTFNGKTFDLPLLRTRFIMNRLSPDPLDKPHIDLLPIARRLYKLRLQQCRLSRIEADVLGIPREGDLPGSEAPERFFSFLKTGEFALLDEVLNHNEQDVASMLVLLSHICAQYTQPEQISFEEDLYSMGIALEKEKHASESRRVYRMVPYGNMHAQSQLHLAVSHRRAGERDAAKAVYLDMIERGEGGVEPYIALAKHYEHVEKDLAQAISYTRQALILLAEPTLLDPPSVQETRNALQYRYDRLIARQSRKGT
ncbi:MAG: ribonuclease H-like domain-containing protein [Clostridia bacterium]|nr:ribonuclease H-like domain-containing protein [Clostridia bacterium]